MAIPVIASSTSQSSQTTTLSVAEPSSIAANDLIIILAASDKFNTYSWTEITTPDAYTSITHANNGHDTQAIIYWRIATGSETWPLSISDGNNNDKAAWALRITGVDTSDPINQTGTWAGVGSQGSTLTIGEVTTDVAECLGLYFTSTDGGDMVSATVSGTGWSRTATIIEDPSAGEGTGVDYGEKELTSAAATVDVDLTYLVSDGRVGIQIAIAPTGGAPSTWPHGPLGHVFNGPFGGPI